MYFADLGTSTAIAGGPHVRAVGWLAASHPFATGELAPLAGDRVAVYAARWRQSVDALDWPMAAGLHTCELCGAFDAGGNFGVPAGDLLFVCPEMLGHYVTAHRYLPPREFVDALAKAPLPGSAEYRDAVRSFRVEL